VLVLILLVSAVATFAQTESARISGRVTDLSGAVIVGSECKITNIETNVSTSTTTASIRTISHGKLATARNTPSRWF
jgi:hypothetical protein